MEFRSSKVHKSLDEILKEDKRYGKRDNDTREEKRDRHRHKERSRSNDRRKGKRLRRSFNDNRSFVRKVRKIKQSFYFQLGI